MYVAFASRQYLEPVDVSVGRGDAAASKATWDYFIRFVNERGDAQLD